MSNIRWIKLSTNMFEDEKIRLIEQMPDADTILIIWVKLLSQAGKTNASGYIYLSENIPYTEEMLATIFNRPVSTVRLALNTFVQFGMISIDERHFISISNWEKHQNVDALEKIRKQTRKRVAKHRRKQKEKKEQRKLHVTEENEKESHNDNGNDTCNVTVTKSNATEEELEEEVDKERDIKNKVIRDLFDHYLSKNIIQHRRLTGAMRTAINARLRDYSFDELKKALDNYAAVIHSDNHWFTHKYPLADFMRDKDVRKFLDEADPLNNFRKNQNKFGQKRQENVPEWFDKRNQNEQQTQGEPVDEEEKAEILALLQRHSSNAEG